MGTYNRKKTTQYIYTSLLLLGLEIQSDLHKEKVNSSSKNPFYFTVNRREDGFLRFL